MRAKKGVLGCRLQPSRDGAQQFVAGRVSEDVVGFLEMIEIDGQHREGRTVRLGALEHIGEVDRETDAIR
jgi:hypothetical protein